MEKHWTVTIPPLITQPHSGEVYYCFSIKGPSIKDWQGKVTLHEIRQRNDKGVNLCDLDHKQESTCIKILNWQDNFRKKSFQISHNSSTNHTIKMF